MQCQHFLPRNQRCATWRRVLFLIIVALAVLCGSGQRTLAQPFTSGSNGTDGALTLTTPGIIEFDPLALGLDADRDNVYHFTTITIGAGVTARLTARFLDGPVFWLASGAVQVDGVIDLNGETGQLMSLVSGVPNFTTRRSSIPGAGGYPGGIPGFGTFPSQPGAGPGRGEASTGPGDSRQGGGAGHAVPANCGNFAAPGGLAYGNNFLVPLVGGSGGGGAWTTRGDLLSVTGGGAGGGAILIASNTSITLTINGRIAANGGNGITSGSGGGTFGGGGSGGAIHLLAPIISGNGQISAGGSNGGCNGSPGRIRLEAFQHNFSGSVGPTPVLSAPIQVILPTQQPRVRVVRVGGQTVPRLPTASFTTPDVTINSPTAVPVEIEAHDIPEGTLVQVHVFTENATDQTVPSSPLVATPGNPRVLTATANVLLQAGFSRMFVRATWQ